LDAIRRCITNVGYIPRQRNVFYDYIDEVDEFQQTSTAPLLPVI
jgi:cyclic dehypoxanthinyl futalosine synthase